VFLGILSVFFYVFQVMVAYKISTMAKEAGVGRLLTFTIYFLSWLICIGFLLQYLFLNIDYIKGNAYVFCDEHTTGCGINAQILATTAHQTIAYLTTLFVLYHCRQLNQKTKKLLFTFQATPRFQSTRINDLSDDDEPDDVVQEVQLPRKITLFRVVMERKLGIDWEHDDNQSVGSFRSMQTNQVVDENYADVHTESEDLSPTETNQYSPLTSTRARRKLSTSNLVSQSSSKLLANSNWI
jgi:hypothetical protein